MKINRNKTRIILDNKDVSLITHHNGYCVINGNYLVKDEYIEFKDTLLQYKVQTEPEFTFSTSNGSYITMKENDKEVLINLLKTKPCNPLRITDLYYQTKYSNIRVLINLEKQKHIGVNADFTKFFDVIEGQKTCANYSIYPQIYIHNKKGELQGLFMPIANQSLENEIYHIINELKTPDESKEGAA